MEHDVYYISTTMPEGKWLPDLYLIYGYATTMSLFDLLRFIISIHDTAITILTSSLSFNLPNCRHHISTSDMSIKKKNPSVHTYMYIITNEPH